MPGGLYDRDVLAWSEQQADLLRRLSRGERVNDVDWDNVVEEIEGVGRSELHSVEGFLELILVHLLKLHAWPGDRAAAHWRGEVAAFQANLRRRFSPSMRQRIDLAALYAGAADQVREASPTARAALWPAACPSTLDELMNTPPAALSSRLPSPPP